MSMKSWIVPAVLATAIGLAGSVVPAAAAVKVGVLTCRVAPGVGLLIGSSKRVACDFSPTGYSTEHYSGRISKLGVDVGFTTGGGVVWGVFSPPPRHFRSPPSGHYRGATAAAPPVTGAAAQTPSPG